MGVLELPEALYVAYGLIAAGVIGLLVGLLLLRRKPVREPPPIAREDIREEIRDYPEIEEPLPDHSFNTFVVGQTQVNHDGTLRQDIIAGLTPGDPLTLLRRPHNPDDTNAIAVVAAGGMIGYLPGTEAAELAPAMDNGAAATAAVDRVIEGMSDGKPVLGVWIQVARWDQLQAEWQPGN